MLRAINKKGEEIIPSLLPSVELTSLRKQTFYCPECKEKVIFRAGPKVIPHFAHYSTSTCPQSASGESHYHKRAKMLLYKWLHGQGLNVSLEKHIREINQRPDLYVKMHKRVLAIEFQRANITFQELQQRNGGYHRIGITPIWLLGYNQFKQLSPYTYRVSQDYLESFMPFQHFREPRLLYFCPNRQNFNILNDFYFIHPNKTIAHAEQIPLHRANLHHLFLNRHLSTETLYSLWYKQKKGFRLGNQKVYGKELVFRRWLYNNRLHVEQLPSIIHLPISFQHKIIVPIWHWQSKLVLNILVPLEVGATITIERMVEEIISSVQHRNVLWANAIVREYLNLLEKISVVKRLGKNRWRKTRKIVFHRYIEQSLRADKLLMDYLKKNKVFTHQSFK